MEKVKSRKRNSSSWVEEEDQDLLARWMDSDSFNHIKIDLEKQTIDVDMEDDKGGSVDMEGDTSAEKKEICCVEDEFLRL
ncbi:hypothetical protein QVD17_13838 [Tagetes erecta]|uniref:Uncharacterized protein n=1 Tax=Tagetes erecta TaxID=13708 RepID=A0AAD8L3X1_TARER|nr:hypothetical protein QVD17_13838 [Tagetes erecta]